VQYAGTPLICCEYLTYLTGLFFHVLIYDLKLLENPLPCGSQSFADWVYDSKLYTYMLLSNLRDKYIYIYASFCLLQINLLLLFPILLSLLLLLKLKTLLPVFFFFLNHIIKLNVLEIQNMCIIFKLSIF
jgi:hypothetical protein